MKAIIIGGGIGGLASALALTRRGWQVGCLGDAAHAMTLNLGQGAVVAREIPASHSHSARGAYEDVVLMLIGTGGIPSSTTGRRQEMETGHGTRSGIPFPHVSYG